MAFKSLTEKLASRIQSEGPISVADFMDAALGDEDFGYYMTRDPFGERGDFITAPEISQMFGELIGLWCASLWLQIGSPSQIHLAELGPGRGTLMADILRSAKTVPGFADSLIVHLVEMSPHLKSMQAETLENSGHIIQWHATIDDLPSGPILIIANEFFDALPIHQFINTPKGWCERRIGLNSENQFEFTTSNKILDANDIAIPTQLASSPAGSMVETCPLAETITTAIATRIKTQGGAALFIDYGYTTPAVGETLQALSKHTFADVLQQPGEQDLTAHVNFSSLATAAQKAECAVFGPITQAKLLFGLGLEARANTLIKAATPEQAHAINAAATRLTRADQMGTLFKALAITTGPDIIPAAFT